MNFMSNRDNNMYLRVVIDIRKGKVWEGAGTMPGTEWLMNAVLTIPQL